MRKMMQLLLILFVCVIVSLEPVYANSCKGLLTVGAYELLQDILNMIRIFVPVLLILLVSMDLGSAVISEDKDGLKKATTKTVKRIIAAIVIFFIPLLVEVFINIAEDSAGIVIVDDPMCGLE